MALVSEATHETTVKLVYYGPALAGKTTNLRWIHGHVPCRAKGKLVSLATDSDRTLFCDLVPLELGTEEDRRTRIQLYTVPGQVFREGTWRLVLKRCDGIVFVADSEAAMLEANLESLRGLQYDRLQSAIDPSLPQVIQYNKRDRPTALPLATLEARLNPGGLPHYEAVARDGAGVEETLRGITTLVSAWLAGGGGVADAGRRAGPERTRPGAAVAHGGAASPTARAAEQGSEQAPDGGRLSAGQWLYLQHGRQQGPVSFDDLVDLVLAAGEDEIRVWQPGSSGWVSATRVAAIAEEIPPPLPSPAAPASTAGEEDMPDFDTVPRALRSVLIADEDASFRRYLAMPLAAQGFTIYEAADGAAAWRLALENRPALILADVSMPELDGFEFCRRVRSHPQLRGRPLLFISGSDKYRERYRALQTGADDFLSKSTPVRELLIRMQLLLTRSSDLAAPHDEDDAAAAAESMSDRSRKGGADAG